MELGEVPSAGMAALEAMVVLEAMVARVASAEEMVAAMAWGLVVIPTNPAAGRVVDTAAVD